MQMSIKELYAVYEKCSEVSTDSRQIKKDSLFFALKGPNFNGNEYADEAIRKGASYSVIDQKQFKKSDRQLLVEDSLHALQHLANYHRNQFNIPFIGIAGSNGKTTTKELISAVLQTSYEIFATPGNYNNEIGVPLTLLKIKKATEIGVIEMGARNRGDIKELCQIANPTHGMVTNTGKDHLETFKTLENTLATNAELYEHLAKVKGTAFVNILDQGLMEKAGVISKIVTYGQSETADYHGAIADLFPYLSINYYSDSDQITINSRLSGKYNFENIMAAVAIGKHFKVPDHLIKKAIENYMPTNNRSQILRINSNTFILDAYNANPTSMQKALEHLADIKIPNKIAILGDMLELGDHSYEEHFLIIKYLKSLGLKQIVLVGKEFEKVKDKIECIHFKTVDEAKLWFNKQKFEHTTFLLKGSRMIGLEKLLD